MGMEFDSRGKWVPKELGSYCWQLPNSFGSESQQTRKKKKGSVLCGLGEEHLVFTSKFEKLHFILQGGAADT